MMMRSIAIVACIVATAPAVADAQVINGTNVRLAAHSAGAFRQGEGKNWGEYDNAGNKTFSFVEDMRDEWSVYLTDTSRGVRIQIDLYRKKIRYADNNSPNYADMYDITVVNAGFGARPIAPAKPDPEPDGGGPVWNNSPPTNGAKPNVVFYGVEGGSIYDQAAANARCPTVAQEVGGTWTGQWRGGQSGYPGVCMVRFQR